MTQPPIRSGALRGAIDLSGLGQGPAPTSASGGPSAGGGLKVDGTDANFSQLLAGTRQVAALMVLWSSSHPETKGAVDAAVEAAGALDGRLRVIAVDIQTNPGIGQAIGAQQVPMTLGLVGGQPVPMFAGVQPAAQMRPILDELLRLAVQNGVSGRIAVGDGDQTAPEPEPMPSYFAEAYDAIERGDLSGAATAFQTALKDNPADSEAAAGLAQVRLMERTASAVPDAARAAAAANPNDIPAQLLVADLDLVGGHVEDAFSRLIDLVRRTVDPERTTVREHLVELFDVVGPHDPRVIKARRALMSALF